MRHRRAPGGRRARRARFQILATERADEAIKGLRGEAKRSYERHKESLRDQGCRAAGYRLLDDDGSWSDYCCLHIYGKWRVITTFEDNTVYIVSVGQHDGDGFYGELGNTLKIRAVGARREQKPQCCGTDGWPTLGPFRNAKAG